MNNQQGGASAVHREATPESRNDWRTFLLLAFIGLPMTMVLAITAYGFVVWFLQIVFFGPPS